MTAEPRGERSLVLEAERWIEPYWNAEHLRRTRDWVLVLEPGAGEALQIAALTHDIERMFPGSMPFDPMTMAPDDRHYNLVHSERSAGFVTDWLREQGAATSLVTEVELLILLHECGGSAAADILQAADSLSFLEVNVPLVQRWIADGRAGVREVRAKHRWTFERIRSERGRELALPYFERAMAAVGNEVDRA
jgi:hypothetical protein